MRLFGGMERIANAMERMGAEEGEVITHPLVTRSIGKAQKRVEGNNFEARKRLLDYDDVMNQQREVIYDLRLFALEGGEDLKGEIWEMVHHAMEAVFNDHLPDSELEEGIEVGGLRQRMLLDLHTALPPVEGEHDPEEVDREDVLRLAEDAVRESFDRKIESFGEHGERVMSFVMLSTIDGKWKDHLYDLDHLKASIGFRGWGQKDPLIEYKKEAYEMFVSLMDDVRRTVTQQFFRVRLEQRPAMRPQAPRRMSYSGPSGGGRLSPAGRMPPGRRPVPPAAARRAERPAAAVDSMGISSAARRSVGAAPSPAGPDVRRLATNRGEKRAKTPVTVGKAPGRNQPCPCGSGRKYKKCHGARV